MDPKVWLETKCIVNTLYCKKTKGPDSNTEQLSEDEKPAWVRKIPKAGLKDA